MNETDQSGELNRLLEDLQKADESVRRYAAEDLGYGGFRDGIPNLVHCLGDDSVAVAEACSTALVNLGGKAVAQALVGNLACEDVRLRNLSSEVLSRLGDVAVPALGSQLSSLDRDVRKFAVDSLLMIRSEASMKALVVALDDSDVNVSATAADGLGGIGNQDHLEVLATYLGAEDEWMRCAVVRGIASIGGSKALRLIRPYLADLSMVVKVTTVQGIGLLDSVDAAMALVEVLEGGELNYFSSEVIASLHSVVLRLGAERVTEIAHEKSVACLVEAFHHSQPQTKVCAIELIGLLGLSQAIPELLLCLELEDEGLRSVAVTSLSRLKQSDLSLYEQGLADSSKPIWAKSGYLCVAASVFHEQAEPLFRCALESASLELVAAGLQYLPLKLGPSFVELLEQKICDPHLEVRLACVTAMGRVSLERFVNPLVQQLNLEEITEVQDGIDAALIQIGSRNVDSKIKPYLQSFTPEERAIALGRYGLEALLGQKTKMIEALADPHPHIKTISLKLLASIGHISAEMIAKGLDDEDVSVQVEAARCVAVLGENEIRLSFLQEQLDLVGAHPERVEVELIQQMAGLGRGVLSLLRPFLHSQSVWVQVETVEAFKQIGDPSIVEELKGLLDEAEDELYDVLEQAIYELE